MRRGLDHRNPWSAPDDFSPYFRDGERGIRHGRIIQGIKGATVMVIVSPTLACALLLVETYDRWSQQSGRPSHCPNKKGSLLKAGIGVDVARGQVHRRVRVSSTALRYAFCNVGQPYSVR